MTEVSKSAFVAKRTPRTNEIIAGQKLLDRITRTKRGAEVRVDRLGQGASFTEYAARPGGRILKPKSTVRMTTSSVEGGNAGTTVRSTGGGFTTGAKRAALYGGGGTTYAGLVAVDQRQKKKDREALARAVSKGAGMTEVGESAFGEVAKAAPVNPRKLMTLQRVSGMKVAKVPSPAPTSQRLTEARKAGKVAKRDTEWKATKPQKSMKSQGMAFTGKDARQRTGKELGRNNRTYLPGPHTKENLKTEASATAAGGIAGAAVGAATRRPNAVKYGALYGAAGGNILGDQHVLERATGRARLSAIKRGDITVGHDPKKVKYFTGELKKSGTVSAFGVEHA